MILVTGATGRIGNVLVHSLVEGNDCVRVLIRKTSNLNPLKNLNIQKVYGDILDYDSVKKAVRGCKYVYHLAGHINISNKNKELTFNTNIQGTKNILKACEEEKITKLLHTSSIHAFEAKNNQEVIDENTPLCDNDDSRGIYDRSKAIATREVLKSDINSVIVCPTGVVGPYDYRPSFFGKGMIDSIKSKLKISVPGAYDYVDVRDVVKGMICAMDRGIKKEIYLLGGEQLSMINYFKFLQKFTGITGTIKTLKYDSAIVLGKFLDIFSNKSSITPYSIDTLMSNSNISHKKAKDKLGYNSRSIEKSIFDQYIWFKKNGYIL